MGGAGIASGLNLASELIARRQEEDYKLRSRAQDLALRFAQEQQLLEQRLANQRLIAQERLQTPARPRPMSEGEAARLTLGATPGQPFPIAPRPNIVSTRSPTENKPDRMVESMQGLSGGLPSTPGGHELLQSLIATGQTESPAARTISPPVEAWRGMQPPVLPERLPLGSARGLFPIPNFVESLSRRFGGGASGLPTASPAGLPDPSDPSLAGPSGSTEGARVQLDDGSIWIVQGGQWVPEG